jgi:hypothetical protein
LYIPALKLMRLPLAEMEDTVMVLASGVHDNAGRGGREVVAIKATKTSHPDLINPPFP